MKKVVFYLFFLLTNVNLSAQQADVVVFSYDRPMQLYAFLESLYFYTSGICGTSVIYRCSNPSYQEAYDEVRAAFPQAKFIEQKRPPCDFKPIFLTTVYGNKTSDYVVFAVDDIILKDVIHLEECIRWMEAQKAYGFYLRMGRNIVDCTSHGIIEGIPPMVEIAKGIFCWQFKQGIGDWAYPNTVDMTVYRKKDIEFNFRRLSYSNPNHLEGSFGEANLELYGLCYDQSKILNIPLNIVSETTATQQMDITAQQLLDEFQAGLKINISDFYQINNDSTHSYIYFPQLIPRK